MQEKETTSSLLLFSINQCGPPPLFIFTSLDGLTSFPKADQATTTQITITKKSQG
ncbi:hypothetical protein RBH89_03695 [Paracidovorax avenae]